MRDSISIYPIILLILTFAIKLLDSTNLDARYLVFMCNYIILLPFQNWFIQYGYYYEQHAERVK